MPRQYKPSKSPYYPREGDLVRFRYKVQTPTSGGVWRYNVSFGRITMAYPDHKFDIHVQSGYTYSGIPRKDIIEKIKEGD